MPLIIPVKYFLLVDLLPLRVVTFGFLKSNFNTDSCNLGDKLMSEKFKFSSGQCVTGYVYRADREWAWLTISRQVKARLFVLDSGCEPGELQEFQNRFYVGKAVIGYVLSYNKEKASLRLVLRPPCALSDTCADDEALNRDDMQNNVPHDNITAHIHEGDIVGGRIIKILPGVGGLFVQVSPHLHGRVHFTELQDSWVPEPLSGYHEGQFVKSKVLEISHSAKGAIQIDLSLRLTLDSMHKKNSAESSNNM